MLPLSQVSDALSTDHLSSMGKKSNVQKLWLKLFSNPSQWWDHRLEKGNAGYPDFKHKKTQESLWLNSKFNPPWVEAKLAAMEPGTVELNMFSWNTRLGRYVRSGQCGKALELFQQLLLRGTNPDKFTFVPLLNACASLQDLEEGRKIHKQIMHSGFESDVYVCNSLIDMYAKCGSIDDACKVFNKMPMRDVVTWNAMIQGLVKCEQGHKALELSRQMQEERVAPDCITYVGMLKACASVSDLEEGRKVHAHVLRDGWEIDDFVCSSLIDMYAKCGCIEEAWRAFKEMPTPNVVTWSAIIQAHVKCGQGQMALELSQQMQLEGVPPDPVTLVAIVNACASVGAIEEGRRVHAQIMQQGCESDIFVGNSLIDMYVKCGSLADAHIVFNKMPSRDTVSWTAMLGGYAMHGQGKEALEHFESMLQERVQIDRVTFVSLLSACSHAGLVDEGLHYFDSMNSLCGISPSMEHYSCIVDLLGRAGHLAQAEDLVKTMSCEPDVTLWKSLLGACRVHGNLEVGERIAKKVVELDPACSSGYVLLSNIYAAAGKWRSSVDVKRQRLERGVKKDPGRRTWIEVNNKVHSFTVNDRAHPHIVEIHEELQRLFGQIRE